MQSHMPFMIRNSLLMTVFRGQHSIVPGLPGCSKCWTKAVSVQSLSRTCRALDVTTWKLVTIWRLFFRLRAFVLYQYRKISIHFQMIQQNWSRLVTFLTSGMLHKQAKKYEQSISRNLRMENGSVHQSHTDMSGIPIIRTYGTSIKLLLR